MRRRMTIEKLEKLNSSDSQELVSTHTPEMARRPSPRLPPPRSPLVQIHTQGKYSTPTEEMVPKVKIAQTEFKFICLFLEQTFKASSYDAKRSQARGSDSSHSATPTYYEATHP